MFRTYRNPYTLRRKKNKFKFWPTVLWLIVALVGLELGAKALVLMMGNRDRINDIGPSANSNIDRLNFISKEGESLTGMPQAGQLKAKSSIAVGYELVPDQSTEIWTINPQGFRDNEPVPLEKPQGEIRIFLLGGSTAFGQGLSDPTTLVSEKLETRFKERLEQQQRSPEKYQPATLPFTAEQRQAVAKLPPRIRSGNYRIINAAVPGYASGNQLAQLALKILPYQPDVIVVLNGYDDLMLASNEDSVGIPVRNQLLTQPVRHFGLFVTQPVRGFIQNTTFARVLQYYFFNSNPDLAESSLPVRQGEDSLTDYLPSPDDTEELSQRVERYRSHIKQMVQLSAGARVPLIVALQPEITGISPEKRSGNVETTRITENLDATYQATIAAAYQQLDEANKSLESAYPNNIRVFNYYDLFDSMANLGAFQDTVHLTAVAHQTLAERLYNAITGLPNLQQKPTEPARQP
jgi:lysophospholipase L1-like esterase